MCIGLTSSCYRSVLERNEVEMIERNGGSPQRVLLEKKWDCVHKSLLCRYTLYSPSKGSNLLMAWRHTHTMASIVRPVPPVYSKGDIFCSKS